MSEVSATEFGEIMFQMLEKASFPGEQSEKVTDLKILAGELRDGVKAIHDTGDQKHSKNVDISPK